MSSVQNENDAVERLGNLRLETHDEREEENLKEEENEGGKEDETLAETVGEPSTNSKTPEDLVNGENSMYVKLVSSDGHEFFIRRELVTHSEVFRNMLDCPTNNADRNTIYLDMLTSPIVRRICLFFHYRVQFTKKNGNIEDFDIPPEEAIEVLLASNFFDL
ncbi:unnamed protein product [Caenorhabditis sp. 36 PRJEB53466]|nr:unnamed protein product [Caenorhabditis sp. 36 PRJEB53466]